MFKQREDLYHAISFETQEEALDWVKTETARLKKEGFTVMDMSVRELFGYSPMPSSSTDMEPEGYTGVVQAKKDAPASDEETEASETPSVN
jgi:hypothetical protein